MPWTFDSALDDSDVTVLSRDDDAGIFEVQIGDLETIVTIELGRFLKSDRTKFFVSHAIHTPLQMGPYRTSLPFGDDPPYALHQAVTGLTMYYRQAVDAGHQPSEEWLVED